MRKVTSTLMKQFGFVALIGGAIASRAAAAPVLADNFARGTVATPVALDASNPSTGTGPWSASAAFTTDGAKANEGNTPANSSAFLPFTPVAGKVYTYSLGLNPAAGASTNWLAFGFDSSNPGTGNSFNTNAAVLWMLERDNRGLQTFFGGNTANSSTPGVTGDAGLTTFQIVLDTTTPLWSFKFQKNGVDFQTGSFAANPAISFIGIGNINGQTGSYQSLSVDATPEPASLGLFGLAGLALLARRRRRPT